MFPPWRIPHYGICRTGFMTSWQVRVAFLILTIGLVTGPGEGTEAVPLVNRMQPA